MRIVVLAAILGAMGSCSPTQREAEQVSDSSPRGPEYNVAYEATEGGFKGMSMFIDPPSGETWVAFRDDHERVANEDFGDALVACTEGSLE